jgi:uncharacterized protein (TIGR03000 family)
MNAVLRVWALAALGACALLVAPVAAQAQSKPPSGQAAQIILNVPAEAQVWFNGTETKTSGGLRSFVTPLLTPDHGYFYTVKAQWNDGGDTVTRSRQVVVQPGATVRVDFNPSGAMNQGVYPASNWVFPTPPPDYGYPYDGQRGSGTWDNRQMPRVGRVNGM